MAVFQDYANYYNLLYQHKDYPGEAKYVQGLIRRHAPNARTLLNLGCGTGKHDFIFNRLGYDVVGIDLSQQMVDLAREEKQNQPSGNVEFAQGDIRTVRLERKFDAVVSLFHVLSYQTSHDDLAGALRTAHLHLHDEGVFVFDCWYGPAVLADPPVVRVKKFEDDHLAVIRIAEPVSHPNQNAVDVNYHVIIRDKKSGAYSEIREKHTMRYLFLPEMQALLEATGLKLVDFQVWMTGEVPNLGSWNVCFVAKK